MRKGNYVVTYTGTRFYPFDPRPEEIFIEDIAHSLSMQCRYNGHSEKFYSVAEHSVHVSHFCDNKLWGLLHDAAEAYIGDLITPLKTSEGFGAYRKAEARIMKAVCKRFDLPQEMPEDVKKYDNVLLATEIRDLGLNIKSGFYPLGFKINPMPPTETKMWFMRRFIEVVKKPVIGVHFNPEETFIEELLNDYAKRQAMQVRELVQR